MHIFWNTIIRPLLATTSVKTIVEIGVYLSENTRNLLEYCAIQGGTVHAIDPEISEATTALQQEFPELLQLHQDLSLNILPNLTDYDCVCIDGDHNWYTVYHELLLIEKNAKETGSFPIVLLHDVEWPYGRRDMYYNIDCIPQQYRQAHTQGGILYGKGTPVHNNGINRNCVHSIYEHTIQNGVQTAIDDFLKQTDLELCYNTVSGFHGLGVLVPKQQLDQNPKLQAFFCSLNHSQSIAEHIHNVDMQRIQFLHEEQESKRKITTLEIQLDNLLQQEHKQAVLLENERKACEHKQLLITQIQEKMMQDKEKMMQDKEKMMQDKEKIAELSEQSMKMEKRLSLANRELCNVYSTKSWRWTSVLRKVGGIKRDGTHKKFAYTVFGCCKDLWTDFGEPFPKIVRYIRHTVLGKKWPIQAPAHSTIAFNAHLFTPSTFLTKEQHTHSVNAVEKMKYKPAIRIIIAIEVFDEILLRRCLNSITEQTFPEWKVTLADTSGNGDVLKNIVAEFNQHFPEKFVYHTQKSISGDVRNFAVKDAQEMYISFFKQEDVMLPHTLEHMITAALEAAEIPDILYSDHSEMHAAGQQQYLPAHKPGWSPELLLSYDYIRTFFLIKKDIALSVLRTAAPKGSAYTYDILLHVSELHPHVIHVPHALYHRHRNFLLDEKDISASKSVVEEALHRRGLHHSVIQPRSSLEHNQLFFSIQYNISAEHTPKVTILIPTKDRIDLLKPCLESIRSTTQYPNYEVVVIDNNSEDPHTAAYLSEIPETVLRIDTPTFNFAHINNEAAKRTSGELLLLLNNDTEPVHPSWLTTMVGTLLLDKDIGVVGSKLLYPKGQEGYRVQSVGMVVGRHWASLVQFRTEEELGYGFYNHVMRNCSAIGGACLLTTRELFERVGGLDEQKFGVDFGDVDFCLKVQQEGFRVVCNPQAEIIHHESATRGNNSGLGANVHRHEINAFEKKWGHLFGNDPYYNRHFSLSITDDAFTLQP